MEHYDYIIAGGGAAGLSLAYYLSLSPQLQNKRVLLIDKDSKTKNDRTWGFWTNKTEPFDDIISWSFSEAEFISENFSSLLPLSPYRYHVIEGARFYEKVKKRLAEFPTFDCVQAEITSMTTLDGRACITTSGNHSYSGDWIFNSCFKENETKKAAGKHIYLQQHFKGWVIKTAEASFKPDRIRLFDFRTPQKGCMRFFYLIPQTENRALVEYTLFSANLLDPHRYEKALEDYIRDVLKIEDYKIIDQESGVIPMTNFPFPQPRDGRIINIGSAGGASKPSTGFTFLRIQNQCHSITKKLERGEIPFPSSSGPPRFKLYDEMLLNIMDKSGGSGEKIFSQLFRNNPAPRIFKFLDEETTLGEDLLLMNSVPRVKFIHSLLNLKFGFPFP